MGGARDTLLTCSPGMSECSTKIEDTHYGSKQPRTRGQSARNIEQGITTLHRARDADCLRGTLAAGGGGELAGVSPGVGTERRTVGGYSGAVDGYVGPVEHGL